MIQFYGEWPAQNFFTDLCWCRVCRLLQIVKDIFVLQVIEYAVYSLYVLEIYVLDIYVAVRIGRRHPDPVVETRYCQQCITFHICKAITVTKCCYLLTAVKIMIRFW